MKIKLEEQINTLLQSKDILLMSHVVLGYPSFNKNLAVLEEYSKIGVDLVELQFPYSEPIADGPILMEANQQSLINGTTVSSCFDEATKITGKFKNTIFVIMTYYNLIFQMGDREFVKKASESGISAMIIPDLPPEEASDFICACDEFEVSPIFLVTPKTSIKRMQYIANQSRGLLYCVARTGVSGQDTLFSNDFDSYLQKVRSITSLPIGVGFGVKTKEDVEHLKNKAEIAIVCSEAVKISITDGVLESASYLKNLRS